MDEKRAALKNLFRALIKLDYPKNPAVVAKGLVDEVVVRKHNEILLDMEKRMTKILFFSAARD